MKRCAKVPVVLQMETFECGAASLEMILAYHHKWISWISCGKRAT